MLLLTLVVIVQTTFTDGNDTGRFRKNVQFLSVRPLFVDGSSRVNTHSREDSAGILSSKLQYFFAGLQTYTRFDGIGDIGIQKFLEKLIPIPFSEGIPFLVI
jgi:hypothetical protein